MKKLTILFFAVWALGLNAQNKQSTIDFIDNSISYTDTAKVTKAKLRAAFVRSVSFADSVRINQKKILYGVGDITNTVSITAKVGDWWINTTNFSIWEKTALTSPPGSGSYIWIPDAIWIKIVSPPMTGDAYLANNQTWSGTNTYTQDLKTVSVLPSTGSLYNLGSNAFRFQTAFLNSLNFGSTATGYFHYNSTDQTTNFERVRGYWESGSYKFITEQGGSGVARELQVGNPTSYTSYYQAGSVHKLLNSFGSTTIVGTAGIASLQGTITASNVVQNVYGITPTINQTSTAGYKILWITPFEQSTGSGSKLLMDIGVNSAPNGAGTHTSRFTVDNTGLTTLLGVQSLTDGTGSVGQQTRSFANAYVIATNTEFIRERFSGSNLSFRSFGNTIYGQMFTGGNWFFGPNPVNGGFQVDIAGTARIQGAVTLTNQTVTAAAAAPSTHKVAISINGTTYYLLATTTP